MNPLRRRIHTAMQARGGAAAWTPASIAGLKLWLDASQIVGLNDGDAVTTWSDASGNGWDATQATASKKPTYKANILNSKPVVRFDGVDDRMTNATFAMDQPSTWFAVAKVTGGGVVRFVLDAATGSTRMALFYTSGTTKWTTYADSFLYESGTTSVGTWRSLQAIFNGASSKIIVAGVSNTGNPGTSNLANGYNVGASIDDLYYLGGDLAEVGCYDSVLSNDDLTLVQSYLSTKYGL